ncbi:hypothetical protein CLOM_g8975 [Closterium sp. NIES-68]|nr:hypothetical protein CLOM_g8975 [Closterium sp. NIES-68]GJP84810.1 hypothetical protein CLOP_g14862 [Closterium sp. NIES-67]
MSITNTVLSSTVIDGVRAAMARSSSFEDLSSDSIQMFVGSLASQVLRLKASSRVACPRPFRSVASGCAMPLPPTQEDRNEPELASACPFPVPHSAPLNCDVEVESVLEPTGFGSARNYADEAALSATLVEARAGLLSGHVPQLTSDGSGGTYMLRSSGDDSAKSELEASRIVAVFKPMDEEPLAWNCPRGMPPSVTGEGLKRGTRVGEGAYREVAAYLLDHPVNDGDSRGFAGVPPTTLVRCSSGFFPAAGGSPVTPLDGLEMYGVDVGKVGSLQQFVPAVSNCEDMGPARFPASDVHKIAILDMRLANTDRNGANILVAKEPARDGGESSLKLVPIDHGYCMPESLEECTFEWLYWPQAKQPLSDEAINYIAKLDAENDLALLAASGWSVRPACARVLRASTLLVKKGAAARKTVYDMGSMMVRDDPDEKCALEAMIEEAEAMAGSGGEDAVMACLAQVMDRHL